LLSYWPPIRLYYTSKVAYIVVRRQLVYYILIGGNMKIKNPVFFKRVLEEGAPLDLLKQVAPDLPEQILQEGQTLLRKAVWPEDVFDGERFLLPVETPGQRAFLARF
jgi:hypothetical protein